MKVVSATNIGLVRPENQDMVETRVMDNGIFAVVCDGMGGERSGREASELAISEAVLHFTDSYRSDMDAVELQRLLRASISAANSVVYTKSKVDYKSFGMGTTCVMVYVDAQTIHIANVGDSRAYLLHHGVMEQITVDHTVVEMLYAQGKITKEEMKSHKRRNMLTKAVGVERTVKADYFTVPYEPDCRILLCSDGLSSYCSAVDIQQILGTAPTDSVCDMLIALANQNGGRDNITVAVITDAD